MANNKLRGMAPSFIHEEAVGGFWLFCAAIVAIIIANSPLYPYYDLLIDTLVSFSAGDFVLAKPLLLWVNDGLMALFFLLVGLELKREFLEGELSEPSELFLPIAAALGGMIVPVAIFLLSTRTTPEFVSGWAIPAATDIAFALGVLSLFGPRVPKQLKVFLTSLAIFDDVGAIVIIAIFYADKLSMLALAIAAVGTVALWLLNLRGTRSLSAYLAVGFVVWVALIKSGVHATLAGIVLAMFIPLKTKNEYGQSLLASLEDDLQVTVALVVLRIFAFANAGLDLSYVGVAQLMHPASLGIALGLFVGKQLGVFSFTWLAVKSKLASKPEGISWGSIYGVAVLSGIGFTMSLFIGGLAYDESQSSLLFDERLGILIGSLLSGAWGALILNHFLPKKSSG